MEAEMLKTGCIRKSTKLLVLLLLAPLLLMGQIEICNNGIDDDNDNLIDLNDDDCFCEIIEPVSLIPNPSFEERNCCPQERSQLNCASNWIQASEPTTDFIHTCDWLGWDDFPPPMPFPDGQGIMGFRDGRVRNNNAPEPYWKEYAGACLLNPMLKDTLYKFQFDVGFVDPDKSPPINITFFGTANCDYLPFGQGDIAFGCPTNDPNWFKMGEVYVDGGAGDTWVNTSLEVIPDQDVYAIAIGPACNAVFSPISIYYFFDNLLLANFESFALQISEIDHPCSNDFALEVPVNDDFEYQWYLNGIALAGETAAELSQNYGEGSYQVRIIDDASCRLSTSFEYAIPVFDTPVSTAICEGDVYPFGAMNLTESGFYLDTFQSYNGCDSIVGLDLRVIGQQYDTIAVNIFDGESYEIDGQSFSESGDYPLTLTSSLGCDSLVLLKLSFFNIYIPNSFSPNLDGINDFFQPYVADDQIESVSMIIFDRWGNQLYEGPRWDGNEAQVGVYVYLMRVNFSYGETKTFAGDLTLIR